MKTAGSPVALDALQRLVAQLENDDSLLETHQLRRRLEALDRLDAHLTFAFSAASPSDSIAPELYRRATVICAKLEAANGELYTTIRSEIQRASRPDALFRCVSLSGDISPPTSEVVHIPANGMGFDHLDDLLSGVLQLEEPTAAPTPPDQEMVFYQPTPARHIFHLIHVTELTAADVLVDLGSGLGHVALLVSICTQARCIGVELEAAYIDRARQCAHRLNLNHVTFLKQDVREADLSAGTVFYLYTPFLGSILAAVLDRLRREAATRPIRICSYGPITPVISQEHWLQAASAPQTDRITLFRSGD